MSFFISQFDFETKLISSKEITEEEINIYSSFQFSLAEMYKNTIIYFEKIKSNVISMSCDKEESLNALCKYLKKNNIKFKLI